MTIDFEKIASLQGQVLEPVPEGRRGDYKYWRGAHVGKIALNFARGLKVLGPRDGSPVHFADFYLYAQNVAKDLAQEDTVRKRQYTDEDAMELAELSSIPNIGRKGPSIVFALNWSSPAGLEPSTYGMCHGFTYANYLTLAQIDPYSRELLQSIVDI